VGIPRQRQRAVRIGVYALAKGQNLLRPMVTGWKRLPANMPPPHLAGTARAARLLGLSAAATALLAAFL
jgi:hypothetical protein